MERYVIVRQNTYVDSLAALFMMSVLLDHQGIETAFVGMATDANKASMEELGLVDDAVRAAREEDLVIAAMAKSREVFDAAVAQSEEKHTSGKAEKIAYRTVEDAVAAVPRANICTIAVPGEYACEVTKKALNLGLHCIVFSNNVPLEQEREMKELALEKGLLCMGPDCGVANINGAAFVLSSINNRGPFGICGASGCGIQHVAAFLHEMGSGVSQTIGTGGNDLKEPVGGISMLMGIDALEDDPDTEYIVLISRKPADSVLEKLTDRIQRCKKPVVACFMGADPTAVKQAGAIWADNLDDCAVKALALIGKELVFQTEEELAAVAQEAIQGMRPEQSYVRGIFCGGTYCDEAMTTMQQKIGGIHSNCPLSPEFRLEDSFVSVGNTVIDYGEEEFTRGKPHPTLEPSMRLPAIVKEGNDPETAVILLDFILTPPEHIDPAGVTLQAIRTAMESAEKRGGKIAVVASVLGTDADLQNVDLQREKLRDAGVYVCQSNRQAAQLAAEIIRQKKERDG